ncbi:MAG: TetR/AcrR family transcriptional regulator [Thermodesulfobacteriota bacterium]
MPPSPRQTQHDRKFRKILKVAARLFAKKGYEKVSIEEIAWRLQLTKGSLYHYFKSKEEVLFLIQMDSLTFGITAQTRVLSSPAEPAAKLSEAISTHVAIITKEEVAGALKQQELILPPPMREKVIAARDRYEAIFSEIIREGVEQGVFSTPDIRLSSIAILSMLNGIAKWYSPKGRKTLAEITDAMTNFIIRGLSGGQARKLFSAGPPLLTTVEQGREKA